MSSENTNGQHSTKSTVKRSQSFTELLGHNLEFNPKEEIFQNAHIKSMERYRELHKQSVEDPETFWTAIANEFYWKEKWSGKFMEYNFDVRKGDIFIKFMEGGKTNICYNVLDRIAQETPEKVAFYW